MQKLNFPKAILTATFLIAFTLIAGLFVFGCLEIKKAGDLPVNFTDKVKPVEENNNNPEIEPNPVEPVELETYEAEIFIEAEWGDGEGEVGIESFGGDEGGTGLIYGPQSFDINDRTGYLYLLDSINERVIEYDDKGKYLRDFLIGIGATTDIKIKDEHIYILSFGSDAVYKLDMSGKILETYLITPGKNPGIGTGGIEFDENGNIMVEINVDGYYDEESRFYEIGKNGDEWKNNSYNGYISRDKKGFYFTGGTDWPTRTVQIKDKSGKIQKEFPVKLSKRAYASYEGSDGEGNIYLSIGYEYGSIWDDDYYIDDFFWKYNEGGEFLSEIDQNMPLQKLFKKPKEEILIVKSGYNGYYAREFRRIRITNNENIYWMATFESEGLKIFKYSQVE